MFSSTEYELVDFGAGRKLERFGPHLLDRPAPAAADAQRELSDVWRQAAARYERTSGERGHWTDREPLPATWRIRWRQVTLELKRTDFGHLGVFPEHAAGWQWLADRSAAAGRPLKVLNLFAYTGGASLALAAAGAAVVHVDSARNIVAWARRNAAHSGLSSAPIRWIVEDARRFVGRELRRGNRYDAVVLDPPTYGHGPAGQSWRLSEHLTPLVRDCLRLTDHRPRFILLTCHTSGIGRAEIEPLLPAERGRLSIGPLQLVSSAGGSLPCGIEARWSTDEDD